MYGVRPASARTYHGCQCSALCTMSRQTTATYHTQCHAPVARRAWVLGISRNAVCQGDAHTRFRGHVSTARRAARAPPSARKHAVGGGSGGCQHPLGDWPSGTPPSGARSSPAGRRELCAPPLARAGKFCLAFGRAAGGWPDFEGARVMDGRLRSSRGRRPSFRLQD